MRKALLTAAITAVLASGAAGVIAKPGPNGNNNHGLCTAYFNGSDTGREHKHDAGPFVALEKAAQDGGYQQDNESIEHAVMDYCNATSDKGIGGNPTLPDS